MNKTFAILFCSLCLLLASCGESSSKSSQDENNQEMIDDYRPMHDEIFYEAFLEAFCRQHFDNAFKGDAVYYKEGELKVTSVGRRSKNSDIVKGSLSFQYGWLRVDADNIWFTAYVTANGSDGEYIVLLERGGGYKKERSYSTREINFSYSPQTSY